MKKTINRQIFLVFCLVVLICVPALFLHAETTEERKARLENELSQVEKEIAQQQAFLADKQKESASIERDIAILDAQIKEANLKIKAKTIAIQQLGKDIDLRSQTIAQLDEKIGRGKDALAKLLQRTNEIDSFSTAEVMLGSQNLSAFFEDVDSFHEIKGSLHESFVNIRDTIDQKETEKTNLGKQINSETDARQAIEAQKQFVQVKEKEKQALLAVSKSHEQTYQQLIAERSARAAQIRAALFQLRDSAAIPFGEALKYANEAYQKTGVRPAFLLAILQQESNLGENVGTCNRPGDPESKLWYNIMPGPNDGSWRDDQTIFKAITKKLGLDPATVPLSCPIGKGWGGAMGPSQFIPYTWSQYESRIASATGSSLPSPWNPRDAFFASAIYLSDLGAGNGGYTAERTAALKYYAGGNWSKPQNAFYGNQVMGRVDTIQATITELESL